MRCFCPDLSSEDLAKLNLKQFDFSGKTFYYTRTPMISHFPMNPELRIEKTIREIEEKGFKIVAPLFTMFEDGLLIGKIMIEILKPQVTDQSIVTFNRMTLVGKSFTGPKYLIPKALKEFNGYLMTQDIFTTEFYFWYHSCKECEKEKGNLTVIFGRVK